MINLQVYSVSAINTLSASYYDPFYQFKQYREGYEQGFSLNKINVLSNAIDNTINNHSTQYLTSKKSIDDIFTVDSKAEKVKTLTTQLIFNTFKDSSQPKYLYIYKDTVSQNPDVTTCRVLLSTFTGYRNNTFFELEIIDDIFLRIKHNNGKYDYYLNYVPNLNSVFFMRYYSDVSTLTAERNDMFRYVLDADGYLQLSKNTAYGNKILTLSAANDSIGGDKLCFVNIPESTNLLRSTDNIIQINYNVKDLQPKKHSSWVSYDVNKQNDLSINENKSIFDRTDQYLLHANINESANDLKLNYVTLNNIRSEKNFIKRGTNMIDSTPFVPGVEFRDYTSLQTGNSQELGNDNISLTYVWYDKDILIKNGTDTVFTAPSSLYPYEKLNINDTKFVENGSLAGLTPKLADNIYHLRKNSSIYNNGRYLITWLSGGTGVPGVWVDRYYYPDYISKQSAMQALPVFQPSFGDPIDSLVFVNESNVATTAFFDKKSDMCLEPNNTYKYSRVGVEDINEYVTATSPTASGFSNYYDVTNTEYTYIAREIFYDGTKYNKFNVSEKVNNSNAFTVSFDMYVDPGQDYGYQILGNLTNRGFGVINDTRITPFIFSYGDNVLKAYNTSLRLLYTTTFERSILDVIKGTGLDDYYVMCNNGQLYKVNTLGVKVKMETIPAIISYTNYFYDGDFLYFLLPDDDEIGNDVVKVNKNTLEVVERIKSNSFRSYAKYSSSNNIYNTKNSIVVFDNKVYQLPGREVKYYSPEVVYYVINGKILVRHDIKIDDITFIIQSEKGIVDFAIDDDYIYILHGDSELSVYTTGLERQLTQFLKGAIPDLSTPLSIDLIRQYTSSTGITQNKDIVITYLNFQNKLSLYVPTAGTRNTQLVGSAVREGSNSRVEKGYVATNYSYLNQNYKNKSLNFNLTLTNYLSTEDILQKNISFDYTTLDKGYHTFSYRFDPIQGNISLFVDGILNNNITIQPGKYAIQNLLNDDIYAGTAGFYNNTDLATYLGQPGYYYLTNTRLKNFFIYDRPLHDDEILSLNMFDTKINDLVLSIPAGQRNNIEEIERYFKYKTKETSSKKINIYVKNMGIDDTNMQNDIKKLLFRESQAILPAGVNINDIQFIDFK